MKILRILLFIVFLVVTYFLSLIHVPPAYGFSVMGLVCHYTSHLCPEYKPETQMIKSTQTNQRLAEAFEGNFKTGEELGAQFALYEDGQLSLSLAAGNMPTAQHLTYIFSSGKFVESVAIAMLVDRGHLKYDAPIATYWPEFAKNGKEHILVEDVLRHESGLAFHKPFPKGALLANDRETLGKTLEDSTPVYGKKSRRMYHMVSRGFILSQIVKRVDPKGRYLGDFIKQEISDPLGLQLDFGTFDERNAKWIVPTVPPSIPWSLMNYLLPLYLDVPWLPSLLPQSTKETLKSASSNETNLIEALRGSCPFCNGSPTQFNDPDIRKIEMTSGGSSTGNALSFARLAGLLGNGGTLDGVQLLRPETLELALSAPVTRLDELFFLNTTFTKGGFANLHEFPQLLVDRPLFAEDYFGWGGWGGSIFAFSVKEKTGFGYLPSLQGPGVVGDMRAARLADALVV